MIYLGLIKTKLKPIEWSDTSKTEEIAWLATCQHCFRCVWLYKTNIYLARDNTKSIRCPKCGIGKSKHGDWQKFKTLPFETFAPKNIGWRSINQSDLGEN